MVAWITVIHQVGGAAGGLSRRRAADRFRHLFRSLCYFRGDVHRGGADGAVYWSRTGAATAASDAIACRVAADDGESASVRSGDPSLSAGANRTLITASIMLATIMQGVDTTIANVALPHMQGSLSASQDQIAWVVTSYIVVAAIMTPLTGWLAGQFGIKYVFLISVLGFTSSRPCAAPRRALPQLVIYRLLQGICGAALVPLSQSVLLSDQPAGAARARRWRCGAWGSSSARSSGRRSAAG